MTEPKTHLDHVSAHTLAACLWVSSTVALFGFALVSFVGGRPLEVGGFPWLPAALALAFSAYLGTGVRARFALGDDSEALPLRRLASGLSALAFVVAFPSVFRAMQLSGSAGLYDLWRANMPMPFGLGLSVLATVAGGLFLWESVVAVGEVRGAGRRQVRLLASVLLLAFTLAVIAGLSEMVVGRSYFGGDS